MKTYKLPFPPSIWKAYYRRQGYDSKSLEYREFEANSRRDLVMQKFSLPRHNKYKLVIFFHKRDWITKKRTIRKTDLDNFLKCPIDTITSFVRDQYNWFDDSLIYEISAKKVNSNTDYVEFYFEAYATITAPKVPNMDPITAATPVK